MHVKCFSCSTDHKISTDHKSLKMLKINIFHAIQLSDDVVILLINVKMGWHFNIYKLNKFCGELSMNKFYNL